MPSLFSGVENFTPAFTGQQIAIQAGQGAGQSISRGMATAQHGKAQEFQMQKYPQEFALRQKSEQVREDEFQFRRQQWEYSHQIDQLNMFKSFLDEGMPP